MVKLSDVVNSELLQYLAESFSKLMEKATIVFVDADLSRQFIVQNREGLFSKIGLGKAEA